MSALGAFTIGFISGIWIRKIVDHIRSGKERTMTPEEIEASAYGGPFKSCHVRCDLCSHEWTGIKSQYSHWLVCPNCGNMAMVEEIDNHG